MSKILPVISTTKLRDVHSGQVIFYLFERIIEKGLGIAENLSQIWPSSDYDNKRKLQSLVFPEGIVYSKKNDRVRTLRVNSLFAEIPDLVGDLSKNKNGQLIKTDQNSRWVVKLPNRTQQAMMLRQAQAGNAA
jgi:hypothetical protein